MDNLLNTALDQGKQFFNNQQKTTKKENFADCQKPKKNSSNNVVEGFQDDITNNRLFASQRNRSDKDELAKLQAQYDELTVQYNNAQKAMLGDKGIVNNYVTSQTTPNPYAGKTVKLNGDNTYGYVTQSGVYKWYKDQKTINDTAGKNGCPPIKDYISIDITTDNYKTPGSMINSTPPLLVGGAMQSGQSCGYEGTNVYVTQSKPASPTYSGCYRDTANNPAMILQNDGKVFTYDTCMQRAIDTSTKYFATQNYDSTSGLANCYISNDYAKTTIYDSADVFTEIKLWSFGADGNKNSTMKLSNNGNIYIYNDINIVKKLSLGPPECNVVPKVITASWGANVNSANVGNLTTIAKALNANKESIFSFSIPLDFVNPARGIPKTFDLSYKCGTSGAAKSISKKHATKANVFTLDCSDANVKDCLCYLRLRDGGKVTLNKGASPSDDFQASDIIYRGSKYDATNEATKLAWKDYDVTKSTKNTIFMNKYDNTRKTNKNWIPSNSGLSPGEWFASNDGLLIMQMRTDGFLHLFTFSEEPGCTKVAGSENSKLFYGNNLTNAVYGFEKVENNKNVGNIAYIDDNSGLRNYLSDMIGFGDSYTSYSDYNISGNNISSVQNPIDYSGLQLTKEEAEAKCKAECDKRSKSAGYVFDSENKKCWIKNEKINIATIKTPKKNYTVNLKKPTVKNNASCSKTLVPIFSELWDNFVEGKDMVPQDTCGLGSAATNQQEKLTELKKRMQDLSTQIVKKMNSLENENVYINTNMKKSKDKYNKDITDYIDILKDTLKFGEDSDNTLNSMLNDSDLVVLQENYKYLFWSIFAVSILIVTLSNVNKS
jgi:hypothetical protein